MALAPIIVNFKTRLRETWRSGATAATLTCLVGITALLASPNGPIEFASFDIPFRFIPNRAPKDVLIVYIDETSRSHLKQTRTNLAFRLGQPWPRSLHAELVRRLTELGAKAIVFDVLMDDPWS